MPPVFVINLPDSAERRDRLSQRFKALGVVFHLFPAVNGKSLDLTALANYPLEKRLRHYGKPLSPGEIGCYLSHYQLWQKLLVGPHEQMVIVEDDIEIPDDFPEILQSLQTVSVPWEMIRLFGTRPRPATRIQDLYGAYHLARLKNVPSGACAYVLNRRGAEKLVAAGKEILIPVDTLMDRYWEHGLQIYAVQPYPISHRNLHRSDIDHVSQRKDLHQRKTFEVIWRKKLRRLGDHWGRFWFALRHHP